jgi:putative heme transporter
MATQNMKLSNAFQLGLFGGLGVLVAILLGGAVATLASVITYIFAAIFLALGLDPLVRLLEKRKLPRAAAVSIVIFALISFIAVLIWTVVPTLLQETAKFVESVPTLLTDLGSLDFVLKLDSQLGGALTNSLESASAFIADSDNWPSLLGGVVQFGITVFTGVFGFIVIVVLTIFFLASLDSLKGSIYKLVPGSKRDRFIRISDQVSFSVGRYVIGQVSVAALNAFLGFIVMSLVGLQFALVLGFVVFLLAVIPLIGSVSGASLVVLVALAFDPGSALILAIYYFIYVQIEAYFITPRVMNVAVKVPAPIVVIAALSGGALLGVLGALVAVPFAASVIFIVREIFIPRQNAR